MCVWVCMCMHFQLCPPLCQAPLSVGFPSKNTGVGCHFLLQGIFLTQGSNPSLLHWQMASLPLVLPVKPKSIHTEEKKFRSTYILRWRNYGWFLLPLFCSSVSSHISITTYNVSDIKASKYLFIKKGK